MVCVRMVFKELCVSWFQRQVTEVAVGADSRVERWCAKRQHKEEHSEREYVGGL